MTLVGFDMETVKKAGNRVVLDENGDQVLRDGKGAELGQVSKRGAIGPTNTVYGNCGSSYMYIYEASGGWFEFKTGFYTNTSAHDFAWEANIRGQNESQTDNLDWSDYGPQFASRSWTSGYIQSYQDTRSGTWYTARVTHGVAFLVNGGMCTSGYPNDGMYLYHR